MKQEHWWHTWAAICVALEMSCLFMPVLARAQDPDATPCAVGFANCIFAGNRPPVYAGEASASLPATSGISRTVNLYIRASHGGPFAHHWVEVESSRGDVTIGYGPATFPFIDLGQISVRDTQGNVEKMSRIHLFSWHYNYAKVPGSGRVVGQPIPLTVAQSDALIEKQRHRRFIPPYIPIFHDCRTFVCTIQATMRGKSTLPCYFLFKGYW
jgi:hypothetical protein